MTTLSLVTVVGNPKAGSRTLSAAVALSDAIAVLLPRAATDHGGPGRDRWRVARSVVAVRDAAAAVSAVRAADLLVLATPTYKASFTGLLKFLLDTLPAGSFGHTVVVPLTVSAGSAHKYLADWQLRPVLGELGAVVPVPSLLLSESGAAGGGRPCRIAGRTAPGFWRSCGTDGSSTDGAVCWATGLS